MNTDYSKWGRRAVPHHWNGILPPEKTAQELSKQATHMA